MDLYCPKCRVYAYRNKHKCPINSLIPVKKECRGIADRLHNLSFELMSAGCFTHPVADSLYEHRITIDIEFKRQYLISILGDLPAGWKWYTETVTPDHTPLSVIVYSEVYVWLGFETVNQRIKQIVTAFEEYLDRIYKTAFGAIMLLAD